MTRWTRFAEIEEWLAVTMEAWAIDPAATGLTRVPAGDPPPRGFFCGPEVWGEGLVDPPPDAWT